MNKVNDRDHITEANMVEGPNKKITCKEMAMAIAITAMKPGKAAALSEVCRDYIY